MNCLPKKVAGLYSVNEKLEELRTAGIHDVGGILNLIRPLEEAGVLVERSRDLLETEISNFMVVELEGTVIGCAALYPVCEESGEIACIAIHPDYQRAKARRASLVRAGKEGGAAEPYLCICVDDGRLTLLS